MRFSTSELPFERRLPVLREFFEQAVQLDITTEPGHAVTMAMHRGPGLRWARMISSLSARMERPAPKVADGEDTVCLMIKSAGSIRVAQGSRAGEPRTGDGVFLVYREPASLQFADATYLSIRVPFSALRAVASPEGAAAMCIPRENEALSLLGAYISSLPATIQDPHLHRLAAAHVYDLLEIALKQENINAANDRLGGVRAGRLAAIKGELQRNAALRIDQVAAARGISPRYIQMLFEEDGTTFTKFSLDQRLARAKAMLRDARFSRISITDIALEAGFGDVSYFNRCFRRDVGMTPGEWRSLSKSILLSLSPGQLQRGMIRFSSAEAGTQTEPHLLKTSEG